MLVEVGGAVSMSVDDQCEVTRWYERKSPQPNRVSNREPSMVHAIDG